MAEARKVKEGRYDDKAAPKFLFIHETDPFNGAERLEGNILIEHPNGVYKKANGAELIRIAEAYPYLLKNWRLDED